MPREHIHFVTGRLAEHALRPVVAAAGRATGLRLLDRRAADHRRRADDARLDRPARARFPPRPTRVIVPGYCDGDLAPIQAADAARRSSAARATCGSWTSSSAQAVAARADYGGYDIEILAEINHAPRLPLAEILRQARELQADGADLIDVGCDPGEPWAGVGECVRALEGRGPSRFDRQPQSGRDRAGRAGRRGAGAERQRDQPRRGAGLGLRSRRHSRRFRHARRPGRNGRTAGRRRRAAADRSGPRADRLRLRRQPGPLSGSPPPLSRCRDADGHRQPDRADRRRFRRHQRAAARLLPGAGHPQRADDAGDQLGPHVASASATWPAGWSITPSATACCPSTSSRGW